ncbi:MAG TPA: hypothetical protein VMD04_01005 [Candidatus Margulisiibacteriota bacterium]|nr:hypothetical protein [Candidatus Margulisiibacteriota bacterium]
MFEHYRQPLLTRRAFYLRMLRSVTISSALLIATVTIGSAAFHYLEGFTWTDSVLNCVLIMTGVGTVGVINSAAGKIFTAVYSLFSTLVFFTMLAIIFTPILHRLMHRFHLDIDREK